MAINNFEPFDYIKFLRSYGYRFYDLDLKPVSERHISRMCELGKGKKLVVDDYRVYRQQFFCGPYESNTKVNLILN